MVERLMKTLDGKMPTFHPSCLYLSWTAEGPTPRYRATFCNYRELDRSKNKFSATIKWKELNMDLVVATDYVGEPYSCDMENIYRSQDYLKSHLQKVIRRSNPYKALLTAWHYMDLDLPDLLRRLCIIAVEDSLPLDGYSTIVWFMAAVSKDYKLSGSQVAWLMGYIYDLSMCKHYEQFPTAPPDIKGIKVRSLQGQGRDLVYSILLRRAYGGMKGDKEMCLSAAKLWSARFHTGYLHLSRLARKDIFISPPTVTMRKMEWVVGAIDFHCCPNIIHLMWEKHDEFTEEDIKGAIWHCSSSVTDKTNIGEDLGQRKPLGRHLAVWKVIRKDFLSYARFMLERNA